jgi:hypothetical protein
VKISIGVLGIELGRKRRLGCYTGISEGYIEMGLQKYFEDMAEKKTLTCCLHTLLKLPSRQGKS